MPLSEQEQKLLDELERNLYQSSQDRVVRVDPSSLQLNYRALVLGILIVVVGLVAILVGVATQQPVVGILGFIAMLSGVLLAVRAPRGRGKDSAPVSAEKAGKP